MESTPNLSGQKRPSPSTDKESSTQKKISKPIPSLTTNLRALLENEDENLNQNERERLNELELQNVLLKRN